MYPYNRALNRSLRRTKSQQHHYPRGQQTSEDKMSTSSDISLEKESDIVWDPSEYKLLFVLDNFQLPQIVRVVEGFMLSEDDSLASGTVLTIHGQQVIEKICGHDNNGQGRDISIPLNSHYKVKITVPFGDHVYRRIKDLCNVTPLPKCVTLNKKVSLSGINLQPGRCLIVNSIARNHSDEAFGLLVSTADNEFNGFILPLKLEGNFRPCPFPRDQSRSYFIRELADRPLPIWIEFVHSGDKNPPFGPHLGVIKLTKLYTSNVVYATSIIDGMKYAISFSRDLPVTVEVARGMLDNTATYVRRLTAAKNQIDMDVLSHLTKTSPFTEEFTSSPYENIKALQEEALRTKPHHAVSSSIDGNSAASSDPSTAEDFRPMKDHRFIISNGRTSDLPSMNNSSLSSRTSQEHDIISCSSHDNTSLSSGNNWENPVAIEKNSEEEIARVNAALKAADMRESDSDDSEGDDYEKVVDWMDRPSIKQQKTTRNYTEMGHEYSYPDFVKGHTANQQHVGSDKVYSYADARLAQMTLTGFSDVKSRQIRSTQNAPMKQTREHKDQGEEQEKSNLEKLTSERLWENDFNDDGIPESLGSDLPADGLFSLLKQSEDVVSIKSDGDSVASDYQSVQSDKHSDSAKFIEESEQICAEFHSDTSTPSITRQRSIVDASEVSDSTKAKFDASNSQSKKTQAVPKIPPKPVSSKPIPPKPPRRSTRKKHLSDETSNSKSDFPGKDARRSGELSDSSSVSSSLSKQNSMDRSMMTDNVFSLDELAEAYGCGGERTARNVYEPPTRYRKDDDDVDNNNNNDDDDVDGHENSPRTPALVVEVREENQQSVCEEGTIDASVDERIIDATEDEVCFFLDQLRLSDFKDIFKENQINGQLLAELEESDFVNDIGLSLFQAKKLRLFVQGWRVNEKELTGGNNPKFWSVKDVVFMMESINLKSLAEFCADNQVDGILLKELIQGTLIQCLRDVYNIRLSNIEEKKLRKFVAGDWRPDRSLKR